MDTLRVWKGTCDDSTVYLDLEASSSGKLVTLVSKDVVGMHRACLLYITKEGIRRASAVPERLGFDTTHGGRIALREEPVVFELRRLKKDGCCPHCGK